MDCREIDDLLPGFAVGILEPDEQQEVEAHLAGCDKHPQLDGYHAVVGELAGAVTPMPPPEQVKHRLMARVYQDLHPRLAIRPWWERGWGWLAAAVMAAIAVGLGVRDYSVSRQLAAAPLQWQLQPAVSGLQASGTLVYLPDQHSATLMLHQLPALPANDVYEVWLIKGGVPQPAGVFRLGANGAASVVVNGQPSGYDAVAVTQEPAPNGSATPTTRPLLAGSLH